MLQNYFKILLRNLARHKVFSLINIIGLSVGMAACLLIFLIMKRHSQKGLNCFVKLQDARIFFFEQIRCHNF